MEVLIELILELLLEVEEEICYDKKVSKWIRYPILIILILIYGAVIFGIMYLGICMLKENIIAALFCIIISIIILVGLIVKFKITYKEKIGKIK